MAQYGRFIALAVLLVGLHAAVIPAGADDLPSVLPLQPYIDATPTGGVLRLSPGVYRGPALVGRTMTIEGDGQVTLTAQGNGTVLEIRAHGVAVRGLRFVDSGNLHDQLDAGLSIEGNDNLVENNVFENVLFGISLREANRNLIRDNRISSKFDDPADRGDGLRLWYSMDNRIIGNRIERVRDITVTNALRNRFVGNTVAESRRAMNLLFSHRTQIADNRFEDNLNGVVVINSEGMIIRNNQIVHTLDRSGAGITLKESSAVLVEGNEILRCAVGVMADSPLHPQNRISLIGNRIAYNITGVSFYGERVGHLVLGNRFEHNLWQAGVGSATKSDDNVWLGNYWDDYQGFDFDDDGVGDTPHQVYYYADRIWMENPPAKFFSNSPVFELIDFLERLAPFSYPDLQLEDPAPLMRVK